MENRSIRVARLELSRFAYNQTVKEDPAIHIGLCSEVSDVTDDKRISYTVVVPTIFGQMLVNRYDITQTDALFRTGRACAQDEIMMLGSLVRQLGTNLTVVDAGANFGTFSLGLLSAVGPHGKIHAFEAQRIICNMLAGTIALNAIENIYCYNLALGKEEGSLEVPQFDYHRPLNFGSIEFGPEQRENLSQNRGTDPSKVEHVRMTTLDRLNLGCVDLIKVDVEGMDLEVVEGAQSTIEQYRPVVFAEALKINRGALRALMSELRYDVVEVDINDLFIPTEKRRFLNSRSF